MQVYVYDHIYPNPRNHHLHPIACDLEILQLKYLEHTMCVCVCVCVCVYVYVYVLLFSHFLFNASFYKRCQVTADDTLTQLYGSKKKTNTHVPSWVKDLEGKLVTVILSVK